MNQAGTGDGEGENGGGTLFPVELNAWLFGKLIFPFKSWSAKMGSSSSVLLHKRLSSHPSAPLLSTDHRNTVAAASGSFVSTIAGAPLDSIKSRLQVKRYSGILDCVRTTFRDEGTRGFFRGVTVPLITVTAVRTASYTIYSFTKADLARRKMFGTGSTLASTASLGFLGGAASGVLLSVGTTCFELLKISMR